jgi:predicted esterase YcpF (UPF0227 family)
MTNENIPIFYIPGYNASGKTTNALKRHFPLLTELTYEVGRPSESLNAMSQQIANLNESKVILIASSLGGWFAERLSTIVKSSKLKIVLYNPSINAETNLAKYGLAPSVLNEYVKLKAKYPSQFEEVTRVAIISIDDDVVDPPTNIKFYAGRAELISTDGGHRMTEKNLERVIDRTHIPF